MKLSITLLIALQILTGYFNVSAQVQIISANAENVDTNWTDLGDIIIYETSSNDIYNSNFIDFFVSRLS